MFKIFSILLTTFLLSQAAPLLKTGQVKSYDVDGNEDSSIKDDGYYQAGASRNYTRSGDIVIDNVTGLQWQDNESVTKQWLTDENYNTCYNNNSSPACYDTSGDTATTYCESLTLGGYSDWRLPSIEELETLVDDGRYNPAVTTKVFQHISSFHYWSSTTSALYTSKAWNVVFYDGHSSGSYKSNYYCVRCVRGGQ
jgi:hypothetical protein